MSRIVNLIIQDQLVQREMPEADDELLPGVCWRRLEALYTRILASTSLDDTRHQGR